MYNPNASTITQGLTVAIPAVGTPSGPTGQVANTDGTATDFTIPGPPTGPVPSVFLFATLDGTIAGSEPQLHRRWLHNAATAATVSAATFTGLSAGDLHNQRGRHHFLPLRLGHHSARQGPTAFSGFFQSHTE